MLFYEEHEARRLAAQAIDEAIWSGASDIFARLSTRAKFGQRRSGLQPRMLWKGLQPPSERQSEKSIS